jgi:glycosyltransferase involved in cell wall biosynthesis
MNIIRERYRPSGSLVQMLYGNTFASLPPPRPRFVVLQELGLNPDLPVVCNIGLLRQYKGLDVACDAIRLLRGKFQLIIGGPPHENFDLESLRCTGKKIEGCVLLDRRLTDQEVADIHAASEAALLPYRKITGSTALLTSWSMGRGVVASDLSFFREMLQPEPWGAKLVPAGDATAMAQGIQEYCTVPAEIRSRAALRLAERYSWENCIEPVGAMMRNWFAERNK